MTKSYAVRRELERFAVAMCVLRHDAWGRVGAYVDPDALQDPKARISMQVLRAHAKQHGRGTGGQFLFYQAVYEQEVATGRMGEREFERLCDWIEEGVTEVLTTENTSSEVALQQFASAVRERERGESISAVVDGMRKPHRLAKAIGRVQRVDEIGSANASLGALTRAERKRVMEEAKALTPLATCMTPVDAVMSGGPNRRNVSLAIGGSNDGKTMFLIQTAAAACYLGLFTAYASNEARLHEISARFDAALFGLRIDDLKDDPDFADLYYEQHGQDIGPFAPNYFEKKPGERWCVRDLAYWIEEIEQHFGRPLEALCIDYCDRLKPSDPKHAASGYASGEVVFDELVELAWNKNLWLWTASQAVRKKSGAYWTKEDVADSIHKTRRADVVITLNSGKSKRGDKTMTIFVDKVRDGQSGFLLGPYPYVSHLGRLMPMRLLDADDLYEGL